MSEAPVQSGRRCLVTSLWVCISDVERLWGCRRCGLSDPFVATSAALLLVAEPAKKKIIPWWYESYELHRKLLEKAVSEESQKNGEQPTAGTTVPASTSALNGEGSL
jgi:hypothetical protein